VNLMKNRFELLSRILSGLVLFFGLSWSLAAPQRFVQFDNTEKAPEEDSLSQDQKAKMEKERREDAFQKLKDDSERLHKSAGELKEMIEKSNQHTFSLQIVKKTEEIEKILKDIKRRAKDGF
jgi:hypothetical protein